MPNQEGEKQEVKSEEEKKDGEERELITLTKEQYEALLDRVAELEDASLKATRSTYSLDELAEEAKRPSKIEEEEEGVDWDEISGKELVKKVTEVVNQLGMRLQTEVEVLKVQREIDKCEAKYPDFWEYEEDIRRIAVENPSLSIEKAYKLAKAEKEGGKGEKEKEVAKTKTEKLLNLPPRSGGEKPGVVSSSTKASEVKTLREAALKAWEDTVGKGKTEI